MDINHIESPSLNKQHVFHICISANHPYLKHHKVNNYAVLPGAASLKIAFEISKKTFPLTQWNCIEETFWFSPVESKEATDIELLLFLKITSPTCLNYSFQSYNGNVYASGLIQHIKESYDMRNVKEMINDLQKDNSLKLITHNDAYEEFSNIGITYGSFFKSIRHVKVKNNYGIAKISCKQGELEFVNLLDGAFQSGMAISKGDNLPHLMPISLGKLIFHKSLNINPSGTYIVFTEKINRFRTNIKIFDEKMTDCLSVLDLGIRSGNFHNKSK